MVENSPIQKESRSIADSALDAFIDYKTSRTEVKGIVFDVLLLIIGFLLAKYFTNTSPVGIIVLIVVLGSILILLLSEIRNLPIFPWHVSVLRLNQLDGKQVWTKIRTDFESDLSAEFVTSKHKKFRIYVGYDETENAIKIASRFKGGVDFLAQRWGKYCEVTPDARTYSLIQSALAADGIAILPNKGWYPRLTHSVEYRRLALIQVSIVSDNATVNSEYETICNVIKSWKTFKTQSEEADSSYFTFKKGCVTSDITVQRAGTDIVVLLAYNETGGVHKDDNGNVRELAVIMDDVEDGLKKVKISLKLKKVSYTGDARTAVLLKGKNRDQQELLTISTPDLRTAIRK